MSSEWPTKKLGEVTINFDTKRRPVKEADRKKGPYPYYGASGIVDYVDDFIFDGEYLLVAEDGENLRTRQTPIAFRASGKFWVNNHAHIITGNEYSTTRYLEYAILGTDIQSYLTGAVMPKLTQGNLNKIEIPCPSKEVQKKIVDVLGALDDRITLLRETNKTLEAIAQAIFKSWFIDFDPVRAKMEGRTPAGMDEETAALFPDELVESELGLVPKGWSVIPFRSAIEVIGGGTPKTSVDEFWGGDIPWFSVVDAPSQSDVFVIDTEKKITTAGLNGSSTKLLPVGTTIISARGTVGKIALTGCEMAMNQSCYGLRGKAKDRYFTYFSTTRLVNHLKKNAHGSVFDTITQETFSGVYLAYPSHALINTYENFVDPMMMKIRSNLYKSKVLADMRDALLPRLISGRLRPVDERA